MTNVNQKAEYEKKLKDEKETECFTTVLIKDMNDPKNDYNCNDPPVVTKTIKLTHLVKNR